MAYLLCIDTSLENALVILQKDAKVLCININNTPNQHASFLHLSIQNVLQQANISFEQIDAFALINGPGSYTGLRIGLASIKAFCFALNKPLIALNTLDIIALSCINKENDKLVFANIDARRNEVFGAIYDHNNKIILQAQAIVLDTFNIDNFTNKCQIIAIGNASQKIANFYTNHSIVPMATNKDNFIHAFVQCCFNKFNQQIFSNTSTLEPFYLKETFITPQKTNPINTNLKPF